MSRFTFATEAKSSAAEVGAKKGTARRRQRARAKARMTRDEKAGSSYTYRGRYPGHLGDAAHRRTTACLGGSEGACGDLPPTAHCFANGRSEPEDHEAGRCGANSRSLRATISPLPVRCDMG